MDQQLELTSNRKSYTCIDVLPFLIGRKIDHVTLGYLHALRPSSIRVSRNGTFNMDSRPWRVSIGLGKDETIKSITQEVEVGLYEDIQNGNHLRHLLHNVK